MLRQLFKHEQKRRVTMAVGYVTTDPSRCVQCGVCTYNCPAGINIRAYAWRGLPITDGACLGCGECVKRCPRGVLSFQRDII